MCLINVPKRQVSPRGLVIDLENFFFTTFFLTEKSAYVYLFSSSATLYFLPVFLNVKNGETPIWMSFLVRKYFPTPPDKFFLQKMSPKSFLLSIMGLILRSFCATWPAFSYSSIANYFLLILFLSSFFHEFPENCIFWPWIIYKNVLRFHILWIQGLFFLFHVIYNLIIMNPPIYFIVYFL